MWSSVVQSQIPVSIMVTLLVDLKPIQINDEISTCSQFRGGGGGGGVTSYACKGETMGPGDTSPETKEPADTSQWMKHVNTIVAQGQGKRGLYSHGNRTLENEWIFLL